MRRSSWTWILAFGLVGVPTFVLRFSGADVDPIVASVVFGLGIVGGAFLLPWGAEAAQVDVAASFAIAVLALIAVLPEYTIEAVLAWDAGAVYDPVTKGIDPATGEVNQLTLLIGSMAVIFSMSAGEILSFPLDSHQAAEFLLTSAVSVFALVLIFPRQIKWTVGAVLLVLFLAHLPFTSTEERRIFTYIYLGLSVGVIGVYSIRYLSSGRRLRELFKADLE